VRRIASSTSSSVAASLVLVAACGGAQRRLVAPPTACDDCGQVGAWSHPSTATPRVVRYPARSRTSSSYVEFHAREEALRKASFEYSPFAPTHGATLRRSGTPPLEFFGVVRDQSAPPITEVWYGSATAIVFASLLHQRRAEAGVRPLGTASYFDTHDEHARLHRVYMLDDATAHDALLLTDGTLVVSGARISAVDVDAAGRTTRLRTGRTSGQTNAITAQGELRQIHPRALHSLTRWDRQIWGGLGNRKIVALTSTGESIARHTLPRGTYLSQLAAFADGACYLASTRAHVQTQLVCLRRDGALAWSRELPPTRALAVSSNGWVFVGGPGSTTLSAYDPSGTPTWSVPFAVDADELIVTRGGEVCGLATGDVICVAPP
jgi:hypothetical protein